MMIYGSNLHPGLLFPFRLQLCLVSSPCWDEEALVSGIRLSDSPLLIAGKEWVRLGKDWVRLEKEWVQVDLIHL